MSILIVFLGAHVHTFLLGIYLGMNLDWMLCGCAALVDNAKQFSKAIASICAPISSV